MTIAMAKQTGWEGGLTEAIATARPHSGLHKNYATKTSSNFSFSDQSLPLEIVTKTNIILRGSLG